MSQPTPYAFDTERLLGTVFEVGPTECKAILRSEAVSEGRWLHGARFAGGKVGEFVVVECSDAGIFAKITEVTLPEKERKNLAEKPEEIHPIATIQLLTTFSPASAEALGGIISHPMVGNRIFAANPKLVKSLAESGRSGADRRDVVFEVGSLPDGEDIPVAVTPEKLFGRHCAVLGSTGGGKSFTLARLVEEAMRYKSKILLLDATGEFHKLAGPIKHYQLGGPTRASETTLSLPYSELTEHDLFALFSPSPQSQAPKLRAAFKSLKLARLDNTLSTNGIVLKAGLSRTRFETAFHANAAALQNPKANFEIEKLTLQIEAECVWPTDRYDQSKWGGVDEGSRGYCVSLLGRIEALISGAELACVFRPVAGATSVFAALDAFLADPDTRVMRISMRDLSFAFGTREIIANALGRHVLDLARSGRFTSTAPLVVMLDEAHQFLNKTVGDDATVMALDAFEVIAKEGRKHWLTICMATQRPRDIAEGVLSQMGTLIVHRLTNPQDRNIVEKAAGQIDQSAAQFLPTLAPGEAAVIGVDFPIPLTVQISRPKNEPASAGPNYQEKWANPPSPAGFDVVDFDFT